MTEGIKNRLVYDAEIEPIYIAGDFGVYSHNEIKKSDGGNIFIGNDFYISEKKNNITELITDGYPFFAGNIRLKFNMMLKNRNVNLKLDGAFQCGIVYINGKIAGKLFFGNDLDISSFAKEGENTVEVDTIIGNRNLLGPHHYAIEPEPLGVNPEILESGPWNKGNSKMFKKSYAFVSAKLFNRS